jgi:hypothetical protein
MLRFAPILLLALAACATGARGDWLAVEASGPDGTSTASGTLYVDRDGETELDITLAGDGPTGVLEGTGVSDLDGDRVDLNLTGTWTDDGSRSVPITGPCTSSGDELDCDLMVDDLDVALSFRREPALD